MSHKVSVWCIVCLIGSLAVGAGAQEARASSVTVGRFPQEVATKFTTKQGLPSNDVRSIAVAPDGSVYAGTGAGLGIYQNGAWTELMDVSGQPVDALGSYQGGGLGVVGGMFYYESGGDFQSVSLPADRVYDIATAGGAFILATDRGVFYMESNAYSFQPLEQLNDLLGDNKAVYQIAIGPQGAAAAAASGLYISAPNQQVQKLAPSDDQGRSWALQDVRGTAYDSQGRLWFASPQGAGMRDGGWNLFTGDEGLPYNGFTVMAAGPDGAIWFGTTKGIIRFDGAGWHYRQGRRWLPGDEVRDIAIDADGNAWVATDGGVGFIEFRPMTLREKAEHYEEQMERIRRTEYGYVSEIRVSEPGNINSEIRYSDSDNDGLWTSMYGAGVCFAYGATKDPIYKERAVRAFKALKFLSDAPAQGVINQQPGYVARTVVPTTEPDPNERESYTLEGQIRRQAGDRLWKAYYPRFVLTEDGKYWYKTDTSSDELDGHYFFYPLYYDLVCETEEEKEEVRDVVRRITDHLVRNNFRLIDHDGTVTRWSDYSPQSLNHDINWYVERGLKSLSMLSYLAVAHHMTGDQQYKDAMVTLSERYAYDMNAMVSKIQRGIGSGNQSDDEMAIMCYYNLIKYTDDPELRDRMLYSFYKYWILEFPEMNPFFNFAYAAHGLEGTYESPWSRHFIAPWDGWLEDAIATLIDFPLDRFNWAHQNSHRLDIQRLPRQAWEPYEPIEDVRRSPRGYRVNEKVIPVSNRHFNHWNTNPWALDYGGDGHGLGSGTVYLLPYYMGLYHGFIQESD
jgi:hypothetical protein